MFLLVWAAKPFLPSSPNRAIHERLFFSLFCALHVSAAEKFPHTEGEWLQTIVILYIPHYQNQEAKVSAGGFNPLELLVLLPPHQQLKMVHHVREPLLYYWSWDTSYHFSLVGARWHSFTFEVTLGDNEIGGPFHLHTVSLITVCQLLVWPCVSAH